MEEFDPCEYCPKYKQCTSSLKEIEDDLKKKQECPETETNFNNQYEILT